MPLSRRRFLGAGVGAGAAFAAGRFVIRDAFAQGTSADSSLFPAIDRFAEDYLRAMHAPGLTLALADRDGVQRIATHGFADPAVASTIPVDALFEIGSITKSFVAICLMQLHDEGRLDLQAPVADLMPWYRITSAFAPITVHHLLTHTSGLPGNAPLFLSDPALAHRAAYPPGAHFHYCNTAFEGLGVLLATLDGRPLGECLRNRILVPLGMTQTEPVITLDIRDRMVKNWNAFRNDRPYPRNGRLAEAPAIVSTDGAGCIASTARDMGLFIRMLANRGAIPGGRLLSERAFERFAASHVKADEFGPTAGYGYGIAVDRLDGHRILRHTGGMVSFASALQVDIDAGVGAFASINAMQGFRPNPVAQYAMQSMRSRREQRPAPPMPTIDAPTRVAHAADFAGTYVSADGSTLVFAADGEALFLQRDGSRFAIESADDAFVVLHPELARFALTFGRADPANPRSAVVSAAWGAEAYAREGHAARVAAPVPDAWHAYAGHFRNENPWLGSMRVVIREGRLWLDGLVPLEPADDGMFLLRDEDFSPEWIRFADPVAGKAMRLKFSGEDFWRVTAD